MATRPCCNSRDLEACKKVAVPFTSKMMPQDSQSSSGLAETETRPRSNALYLANSRLSQMTSLASKVGGLRGQGLPYTNNPIL